MRGSTCAPPRPRRGWTHPRARDLTRGWHEQAPIPPSPTESTPDPPPDRAEPELRAAGGPRAARDVHRQHHRRRRRPVAGRPPPLAPRGDRAVERDARRLAPAPGAAIAGARVALGPPPQPDRLRRRDPEQPGRGARRDGP